MVNITRDQANAGALYRSIVDAAHDATHREDVSDEAFVSVLRLVEDTAMCNPGPDRVAMLAIVSALRVARFGDPTLLTEEERQHIVKGSPINAIRSYRARTGVGLKEAKDFIESTPEGQAWLAQFNARKSHG